MTGHKYGFSQSFDDELVTDLGREQVEHIARDAFQRHLARSGLHMVPGEEIRISWPAFPLTVDPPAEAWFQALWRRLRRREALQPYVSWTLYGHTRVVESEADHGKTWTAVSP